MTRGLAHIDGMIEDALRKRRNARKIIEADGSDEVIKEAKEDSVLANERIDENVAEDDGVAPAAPTGVTTKVFARDVSFSWDTPPGTDHVATTRVEVYNTGTATLVAEGSTSDVYLPIRDLGKDTTYDATLWHEDLWGRDSAPSASVTFTTGATAADEITTSTLAFGGDIANLLNAPELAAISDPGKLAERVVTEAALAQTDRPNLAPYDVASAEPWATGTTPDNVGYVHAGSTYTVEVDSTGRKTMQWAASSDIAEEATVSRYDGDYFFPQDGQAYFYTARVKNVGTTTVDANVRLREKDTAAGTTVNTSSAYVTLAPGDTKTLSVEFVPDASADNVLLHVNTMNIDANGFSLYTDEFMVQEAAGKDAPSAYKPPGITTGVVSAELVSAWDINAVRAVIGDATMEQAKMAEASIGDLQLDRATANKIAVLDGDIVNLTATKITTGTIDAEVITLASGGLLRSANNDARFSASGMSLRASGSMLGGTPSSDIERKISVLGEWAGLAFFDSATDDYRGIGLRADGIGGDPKTGQIGIVATSNGTISNKAAELRVISSSFYGDDGGVSVSRHLYVVDNIDADGNINAAGNINASTHVTADGGVYADGAVVGNTVGANAYFTAWRTTDFTLAGNSTLRVSWTGGFIPMWTHVWYHIGNGNWRDVSFNSNLALHINSSDVVINNNGSSSMRLRVAAHRPQTITP